MSATDDTEELLLADPELSRCPGVELQEQLDLLQTRLHNLEAVSFSDSVISAKDYFLANSPHKKHSSPSRHLSKNILHTIPKRNRRYKHTLQNKSHISPVLNKTDNRNDRHIQNINFHHLKLRDSSIFSDIEKLSDFSRSFNSGDLSNMDSDSCVSSASPEKKMNKSILLEIDTFLNNVEQYESTKNIIEPPKTDCDKENFKKPYDISSKYLHGIFSGNTDKPNAVRQNTSIQNVDSSKTFDKHEDKLAENVSDSSQKKNLTLPSLLELWSISSETKECNSLLEPQRLEEERLRRQHCEDIIQQLQKKLLEQQQKLAVAVQVDSAKDEVIKKTRESFVSVEKQYLSKEEGYKKEIQNINSQLKHSLSISANMKKDLDGYESRFEKLLKIINEKDENYNKLVKEQDSLKADAENDSIKMKDLKDTNNLLVELNKQISENFHATQDNLEKIKADYNKIADELKTFKQNRSMMENELEILRSDKTCLLSRVAEEKSRNSHLDGQKISLQNKLEVVHRKIEQLENEHGKYKTMVETQRNDMKTHYQKQLEEIIKNKISQLQNELDTARLQMTKEVQEKEKEIALQFARHLNKIEQHHRQEISVIEEKHKEQIKIHEDQLNKSKLIIQQLEDKLISYKQRRGEIAVQLQNVMECQWKQALKIISNDSNLKSHSESETNFSSSAIPSLEKRLQHPPTKLENPTNQKLSSHPSIPNLNEDQLQRYVQILLNQVPGTINTNSVEIKAANPSISKKCGQEPNNHLNEFEYPTNDKATDSKFSKSKRPWK